MRDFFLRSAHVYRAPPGLIFLNKADANPALALKNYERLKIETELPILVGSAKERTHVARAMWTLAGACGMILLCLLPRPPYPAPSWRITISLSPREASTVSRRDAFSTTFTLSHHPSTWFCSGALMGPLLGIAEMVKQLQEEEAEDQTNIADPTQGDDLVKSVTLEQVRPTCRLSFRLSFCPGPFFTSLCFVLFFLLFIPSTLSIRRRSLLCPFLCSCCGCMLQLCWWLSFGSSFE